MRISTVAALLAATALVAPCIARAADAAEAAGDAGAVESPVRIAALITSSQPAGFDDLLRPQQGVADVYFGGRRMGQAEIGFEPGAVRLIDPAAVVALLPGVIDPTVVTAALAADRLDAQAGLACGGGFGRPGSEMADATDGSDGGVEGCGRLTPEVAGVIFDQDRYRLDVFVNPRLLSISPAVAERYLPPPEAGLSLVNSFAATVAGATRSNTLYDIQNRALLAFREGRVRSEISYSSDYGLLADTLAAEVDRPDRRYSAGLLWAPGLELTGRRKMLGVAMTTQSDTRVDREQMNGSPLIVFLPRRARVDIVRDGRIVSSRSYDAGNQSLDTGSLPDGSYEVVLNIQEAGGAPRSERRFFTKNPRIPSIGRPIVFGYAGILAEDRPGRLLTLTGIPFVEAGVARRINRRVALDAKIVATDDRAIAEVGGYLLSSFAQLRVAGLLSTQGDIGAIAQLNSSDRTRLNYNIDLRKVMSDGGEPLLPITATAGPSRTIAGSYLDTARLSAGSFTQGVANISYRLGRAQLGVSGYYRRDRFRGTSYVIGPNFRLPLIERGTMRLTLGGDFSQSDRGRAGFVGLSFELLRGNAAIGATAGYRATTPDSSSRRSGAVGGVAASWQRDGVMGGDLNVAGGYERDLSGDLLRARSDLRGGRAAVSADVVHQLDGQNAGTQYSVGFRTTASVGGGTVAFDGREQGESAIIIRLDGSARGSEFEVLVDDVPRGTVRVGSTLPITLPSYRSYRVRVRPIGEALVSFDGNTRNVTVYPGSVASVGWWVEPKVAMFGRALWPDGSPVAAADIVAEGAVGRTDEAGYFQMEGESGAEMTLHAADGRRCTLVIGRLQADAQGYAALGDVRCRPIATVERIAAAETM